MTDPDLAPYVPADAGDQSGHAGPPGTDAYPEFDPDVDPDLEADGDPEAEEDGLRDSRDPGEGMAARLSRRPRDMAISLGVLLAVLFAFFGLYRCLGGDGSARVDPAPVYAQARNGGTFQVLEPSGLPKGWRPVSAVYQPQNVGAVLRIGWRTPDDGNVQLIQGSLSSDILLEQELGGVSAQPAIIDINGKPWHAYPARKGERAIALVEPGRTIIVVGRASDAELKELAAALK